MVAQLREVEHPSESRRFKTTPKLKSFQTRCDLSYAERTYAWKVKSDLNDNHNSQRMDDR